MWTAKSAEDADHGCVLQGLTARRYRIWTAKSAEDAKAARLCVVRAGA
jgi:hypothetical protein